MTPCTRCHKSDAATPNGLCTWCDDADRDARHTAMAKRWTTEALLLLKQHDLGVKVSRCQDCKAVSLAPSEPCRIGDSVAVLFVSDGLCSECSAVREAMDAARDKYDSATWSTPE